MRTSSMRGLSVLYTGESCHGHAVCDHGYRSPHVDIHACDAASCAAAHTILLLHTDAAVVPGRGGILPAGEEQAVRSGAARSVLCGVWRLSSVGGGVVGGH